MNNENIKKGISYVAFGFLFLLVNFNLKFNTLTINVMPDFIGWVLLFFAFDKLTDYLGNKQYLKWTALVEIILSGAVWVLTIAKPEMDISLFNSIVNVIGDVYLFILFGDLVRIAEDFGSSTAGTINVLRWINIISYAALAIVGLFVKPEVNAQTAAIVLTIGAIALVAAIVTMFTLFRLRKDVRETL